MTTHEPVDRQLPGDQAGDEVKNDTLYRSQQDKRLLGIRIPNFKGYIKGTMTENVNFVFCALEVRLFSIST